MKVLRPEIPPLSLFYYLERGETIEHFLDQFPSVSKEQALAAPALARDSLLARARSASVMPDPSTARLTHVE